MTAILRLTNLKWAWLALILAALFAFGTYDVVSAQEGDACSDAVDSDGDGFINDGCPAVGEPEVTAAPTAAPTATQEPTGAPTIAATPAPTVAPTASPTGLPDTGGNPNQEPNNDPPQTPDEITDAVNQWDAEEGIIGAMVAFVTTAMIAFGLKLKEDWQAPALIIGMSVVATVIYIALRTDVKVLSVGDAVAGFKNVIVASQATYWIVLRRWQNRVTESRTE